MYRGLTSTQAFSLIAIYNFLGVIFEYPTGVIGDRYGHKFATYMSYCLNFLAMAVMSINGGYNLYLSALVLLALGNGFFSGNDMCILKAVSTNIKRDTAHYNSLQDFVMFLSAIIGGLISRVSFELALLISGFCMLSASIPLSLLKGGEVQVKNSNSIPSIIKEGLGSLRNPTIKQLFIFIALFGGYFFSVKSIVGSFVNIHGVSVSTIGIAVGVGGLIRSLGGKLYAEFQRPNIVGLTILMSSAVLLMGAFPSFATVIGFIYVNQLLFGYILSKIDGDIHEFASDHVRASLFSLKRLIARLVASGYLVLYGLAIGANQFSLMMYGTGIVLMIGVVMARGYLSSKHRSKPVVVEVAEVL